MSTAPSFPIHWRYLSLIHCVALGRQQDVVGSPTQRYPDYAGEIATAMVAGWKEFTFKDFVEDHGGTGTAPLLQLFRDRLTANRTPAPVFPWADADVFDGFKVKVRRFRDANGDPVYHYAAARPEIIMTKDTIYLPWPLFPAHLVGGVGQQTAREKVEAKASSEGVDPANIVPGDVTSVPHLFAYATLYSADKLIACNRIDPNDDDATIRQKIQVEAGQLAQNYGAGDFRVESSSQSITQTEVDLATDGTLVLAMGRGPATNRMGSILHDQIDGDPDVALPPEGIRLADYPCGAVTGRRMMC